MVAYLDFGPAVLVPGLARVAERVGFSRYWIGEHHKYPQTSCPLLMSAIAGRATKSIRIGSAAVCLRLHSALVVLQEALTVSDLCPGRVDLGICAGLGVPPQLREAFLEGKPDEDFYEKADRLLDLINADEVDESLAEALPERSDQDPVVWLMGMSERSASFAAQRGLGFAVSDYHRGRPKSVRDVLARYRDEFKPSNGLASPATVVLYGALCATTEQRATALAAQVPFEDPSSPAPRAIGTPQMVVEKLAAFAESTTADEIAYLDLRCVLPELEERLEALAMIGEALPHT